MAIWLWILAAWGISFAVLRKKRIAFEHLIWLLMPVDMYGVGIAGATLKPYMLFCVLLLLRILLQRRWVLQIRSWWSVYAGITALLFLGINLFNNSSMSSVSAALMIVFVWLCSMLYISSCAENALEDVSEAMFAAGLGYGLVFVISAVLVKMNPEIPGLIAAAREAPGIWMKFSDIVNGTAIQSVRLRGFMIDPNSVLGPFAFCILIGLFRVMKGRAGLREILALVISSLCIFFCNSRMGLICFGILLMLGLFTGYQLASIRIQNAMKLLILFLILLALLLTASGAIPAAIGAMMERFVGRSGLNDPYGRLSIWKNAVSVWMERNMWLGIGYGQMRNYTTLKLDCHNTWLEMVCAGGLLIGGLMVLLFVGMIFKGLYICVHLRGEKSVQIWPIVLGVLGVMMAVTSVDNLTYSYLWFGGSLVAAISSRDWSRA